MTVGRPGDGWGPLPFECNENFVVEMALFVWVTRAPSYGMVVRASRHMPDLGNAKPVPWPRIAGGYMSTVFLLP